MERAIATKPRKLLAKRLRCTHATRIDDSTGNHEHTTNAIANNTRAAAATHMFLVATHDCCALDGAPTMRDIAGNARETARDMRGTR